MSVEAWANTARQDQYRQDSEHQRAIDAFRDLLEGKTTPNTAGGTLASLYEPMIKSSSNPSPVATLWGILCDAVRVFGGNQELSERLVDLLNYLSQLPDVTDEHGNAITPAWSSAGKYWRDLPELTMLFREYGIDIEAEDEDDTEGKWFDQAETLLNATTFGAMYLARGTRSVGMPFHAEVGLMEGIEVPYQTPDQKRYAAMYVPPAATWVLLAGERIHELCKSDHDRKDGAPGSVSKDEWLWGKGRGYSVGRWALWKKRFGEIAMTEGLGDNVKDLASKAMSEMGKIESQMQ